MSRGVYVALSGAVAQEQALETTATNLANASTPGYQRMRPVFREVLAGATGNTPNGAGKKPNLHYAEVSGTALDGSRGAIKSTGRTLDVALPEGTYLAVTTPRGERFTRAGSLAMSADGTLRANGTALAGADGKAIQLDPTAGEPTIAVDGSVMQGSTATAKLKLVRAGEGTTFTHEGGGLVAARGANGVTAAEGDNATVEVGVLEESNATPIAAMTELVTASRTFEAFQRMLDTFGECDRKVLTTVPGFSE